MNLNFYPSDFNQPVNPYINPIGFNSNNITQQFQQNAENKLQQLQSQISNQFTPQGQNNQSQQPYYLFCGNKNDWDDFLMLNYGITEKTIFDDYKLFLQAKQEILEEQGQNKINTMKDKIRNKGNTKGFTNVDSTIKSNIKPNNRQKYNTNGVNNGVNMGNTSEPNNRPLEQKKKQSKQG